MLSAIVLGIFGGLVALAIVALLTPVRLQASLRTTPRLAFTLEARPFGGLSPPIRFSRGAGSLGSAKKRRPRRAKKRKPGRSAITLDRARALSELPHFVMEALAALRLQSLHVNAEFGLGDPADTGLVYGCLAPLQYGALGLPGVSVTLRPNFTESCLSGEGSLACRFYVAALIAPVIRFAWRVLGRRT